MKYFLLFFLISVTVQWSVAPPVNQKSKDKEDDNENVVEDMENMIDMEYRKYLMEVVQVLESDPEFKEKIKKADQADIRTGKIADELQFVSHNIRTRLDEIKRDELERLRHLATKENELRNGLDIKHLKVPEHLDHTNTRSFEIQDLKKLIAKTSKDLAKADKKRREEFKKHEMKVKYEEEEKLKHMNDVERKKYEHELEAAKEQQKKHEPIHHPGSKQQLEEVWEKLDHMEDEVFNPRTFFYFHDIDGNGVWDQDEVKALFLKELDKLYAQGASTDLIRRTEEMERMREHVFNETDLNKDGLISYREFWEDTKKPDFQQDNGWQGLDEQQIYTQEEFETYARQMQDEMQRVMGEGMVPPHPGNKAPQFESHPYPGSFPGQQGHIPLQQHQPQAPSFQQGQNPPQLNQPQAPNFQQQRHIPPQLSQPQAANFQPGQILFEQHQPQAPSFQQQVPGSSQLNPHQAPNFQQQGHIPPQLSQPQAPNFQQQGHIPPQLNQPQAPSFQQQGQGPPQLNQPQAPNFQQQGQGSPQLNQPQAPNFQQQGQKPVLQPSEPQAPNFQQQNIINQVPENVQPNAATPQNIPNPGNSQPAHATAQEISRNNIPHNEKV